MSDRLLKESDVLRIAFQLPLVVNSAFADAVKALPSADGPQEEVDAIDRNVLIDYCLKLIDVERKQGSDVMNYGQERVNQTEAIIDYIEYMPHVYADRLQGEWIYTNDPLRLNDEWACSRCGNISFVKTNFCDRCGAQMKGADNDQTYDR